MGRKSKDEGAAVNKILLGGKSNEVSRKAASLVCSTDGRLSVTAHGTWVWVTHNDVSAMLIERTPKFLKTGDKIVLGATSRRTLSPSRCVEPRTFTPDHPKGRPSVDNRMGSIVDNRRPRLRDAVATTALHFAALELIVYSQKKWATTRETFVAWRLPSLSSTGRSRRFGAMNVAPWPGLAVTRGAARVNLSPTATVLVSHARPSPVSPRRSELVRPTLRLVRAGAIRMLGDAHAAETFTYVMRAHGPPAVSATTNIF